tara:strand:+ start:275 stop:1453 length:1179 start_codon:yes stop_codon:yes gene_type:complete
MTNRCPNCNALLKDKHLTDGKCWKCGTILNLKTEKKEFKESQKIKTEKAKNKITNNRISESYRDIFGTLLVIVIGILVIYKMEIPKQAEAILGVCIFLSGCYILFVRIPFLLGQKFRGEKVDKGLFPNSPAFKQMLWGDNNEEGETQDSQGQAVNQKSPIIINKDKFKAKTTILSSSLLRYTPAEKMAVLLDRESAMRLDHVAISLYYDFSLRLVKSEGFCDLVIDVHYRGDDWLFLHRGELIIIANSEILKFQPIEDKTSVNEVGGLAGNISEDIIYPISLEDLQKLTIPKKLDVQISGKNYKAEFETDKLMELAKGFYNSVFEGKKPVIGKDEVTKFEERTRSKPAKKKDLDKSTTNDVKTELKKYKEMLDEGLIEQEDYDSKKKELLGL